MHLGSGAGLQRGSAGQTSRALLLELGDAGQPAVAEDAVEPLDEVIVHLATLVEGQAAELLVDRPAEIDRLLLVLRLERAPGEPLAGRLATGRRLAFGAGGRCRRPGILDRVGKE